MLANVVQGFRKNARLFGAAAAVLVAGLSTGLVVGYSSPAIQQMMMPSSPLRLTEADASWFGSLMALGALFGGLLVGYLSDKVGRRGAIIITSIPMMAGWLLIAYAPSILFLFIGRTLTGLCSGIFCGAIPTYLVEISTPSLRGFFGVSFQTTCGTGVLLCASVGGSISWSWLAIMCSVPNVITIAAMLFVPETPLWLMSHGKHEKARQAAEKLYGKQSDMLEAFSSASKFPETQMTFSLKYLATRSVAIPTIYSILLMLFQQCSGISPVTFNSIGIFQQADPSTDPQIVAIQMISFGQLGLLVGSVTVDKIGRKISLTLSGIGQAMGLSWCGCYFYFVCIQGHAFQSNYGWMAFASISIYVFFFSLGFGPIPWMLIPEMIPQRARGFVTGLSTTINWTIAFVVSKTFHDMNRNLKPYWTFWIYACVCVLGTVFTTCFIPETKGKSLEEIEIYFSKGRDDVSCTENGNVRDNECKKSQETITTRF